MAGLRPIGHSIELIYLCPNCGSKHNKVLSEVLRPNAAVHCPCGVITEIQQLWRPRFTAKMSDPDKEVLSERDMRVAHRCMESYFPGKPYEVSVRLNKAMKRNPKGWQEIVNFALEEPYP